MDICGNNAVHIQKPEGGMSEFSTWLTWYISINGYYPKEDKICIIAKQLYLLALHIRLPFTIFIIGLPMGMLLEILSFKLYRTARQSM